VSSLEESICKKKKSRLKKTGREPRKPFGDGGPTESSSPKRRVVLRSKIEERVVRSNEAEEKEGGDYTGKGKKNLLIRNSRFAP